MTRVLQRRPVLAALVIVVICFLPPNATVLLAVLAAAIAFAEYADLAAAVGARISIVATGAAVALRMRGRRSATSRRSSSSCLPRSWRLASWQSRADSQDRKCCATRRRRSLPLIYIGVPLGALAASGSSAGVTPCCC